MRFLCSKRRLSASVTVESSLTVSLSLLALFAALGICFQNHDAAFGSAILHERLELYSHAPEDADLKTGEIPDERLSFALSEGPLRMRIRTGARSVSGTMQGGRYSDEQELKLFEPQKMMRSLTLVEELGAEMKKK